MSSTIFFLSDLFILSDLLIGTLTATEIGNTVENRESEV